MARWDAVRVRQGLVDSCSAAEQAGDQALRRGRPREARRHYERMLAESIRLAEQFPDLSTRRDLSVAFHKYGDFWAGAHRLDQAAQAYAEGLAIAGRLREEHPDDIRLLRDLRFGEFKMGETALRTGGAAALHTAHDHFTTALSLAEHVVESEPHHPGDRRELGVVQEHLGLLATERQEFDEAAEWYARALAVRRELAAELPGDPRARRDLGVQYERLGDLALRRRDLEAARAHYDESLSLRRSLLGDDPRDLATQRDLSIVCERLGDVALLTDGPEQARPWYDDSFAILDAAYGPRHPETRTLRKKLRSRPTAPN
ncbi:tetratricopeptide repeat protein [Streptomyces sp. NPDC090127]|uniref:tetratricopeptide repeat protein n=1 Tax=Streptomyces sp. NPDC090127 TaxID=3365953 RepID=UPI0038138F3D